MNLDSFDDQMLQGNYKQVNCFSFSPGSVCQFSSALILSAAEDGDTEDKTGLDY